MIGALAVSLLLAAAPVAAAAGRPPVAPSVKWEKSFDHAMKKARKTGKPVIVDFWAEWCAWCERLDQTTYADPFVVQRFQDFVAAKVDTEGSRQDVEVATRYEVMTLPTILFLSPQGRQIWRVDAYQGPGVFPRTMGEALAVARNVMAWEETLAHDPENGGALAALGAHLYETGSRFYQQRCLDEARDLLRRALPRDADQPLHDRRRTRMLLAILQSAERNYADAEKLVKDALALGPQGEDEPKLLFVLGRTYVSWGRADEGIATMQMILRQYPHSPMAPKARETIINLQPR